MRSTRSRTVLAGVSVLATIGLAAVVAPPALAGPGCANGYTCVWNADQYSGASGSFRYNNPTWEWTLSDGTAANNKANSISTGDLVSCRVFLYDDKNYALDHNYIYFYDRADGRMNSDPYLTNGGGVGSWATQDWHDRISSNQYISYC